MIQIQAKDSISSSRFLVFHSDVSIRIDPTIERLDLRLSICTVVTPYDSLLPNVPDDVDVVIKASNEAFGPIFGQPSVPQPLIALPFGTDADRFPN